MAGRNLFENRVKNAAVTESVTFASGGSPAVFISHSRYDKEKARELAHALMKAEVDIYFDEQDTDLQLADERNDHPKVVECIDAGLVACTHLLGIITENTKDSWWVPYEIGGARGRKRICAHLIDKEVKSLPSYIQAEMVLADKSELKTWLPTRFVKSASNANPFEVLLETISKAIITYPSFVSENRAKSDLTFY